MLCRDSKHFTHSHTEANNHFFGWEALLQLGMQHPHRESSVTWSTMHWVMLAVLSGEELFYANVILPQPLPCTASVEGPFNKHPL